MGVSSFAICSREGVSGRTSTRASKAILRRGGVEGTGVVTPFRLSRLLTILTFLLCTATFSAADDRPRRLEIDLQPHGKLVWVRGGTPQLEVRVRRGDGWLSLASRYSGTTAMGRSINRANPGLRDPMRDRGVKVPLEVLRADLRLLALKRLFPIDSRVEGGYRHWVLDPFSDGSESWGWLAAVFGGRSDRGPDIRRANPGLELAAPARAQPVLIPSSMLLGVFRSLKPVKERPTPTPTPRIAVRPTITPVPLSGQNGRSGVGAGALDFGVDSAGNYAVYKLCRGEALYSAVVVRFTGQLHAAQVNVTALVIAERSGISDVTDIPVGYPIKIPLDLLLPEFLPEGHELRVAWQREQKELAGFLEVVKATDLSGVHVILDAGHGGRDTGAVVGGVWESTYVYDIVCRIKENLTRHTRATVWTTVRDKSRGYDIPDKDRLRQDRDQVLLTTPEHSLESSAAGVHLRWYLGNDIILDRIPDSVPNSKVVFISVHADSLHSSVRGSMVYVPSRHLRPRSYRAETKGIERHQEYREHPTVKLTSEFSSRAEASSRHLAAEILESLRRNEVPVHANKPIRDRILRGRRKWVPAVLRYSLAQNAVLVECVNMANKEDRANLVDQEWRELFARSLVEGIASAFNGS
ncbi:MAG: N-acetylmuramoyl-L-alanine amidase [Thermoanaerobaculales bacterium]|nr:N-acetylmuramoyl-L-alanine amidase [Thermoanaerobaculales bacterium]